MFNVGIVASGRAGPLVKLSGGVVIGGGSASGTNVRLTSDGLHSMGTISSPVDIPGEWYVPGMTPSIGASYQARFVAEAGDVPTALSGAFIGGSGTWGNLNTSTIRYISGGNAGRYRIEIRDTATQTIQASARFWTDGFAP